MVSLSWMGCRTLRVLAAAAVAGVAVSGGAAHIEHEGVRVDFEFPRSLAITVDGVTISDGATFYVVKPGWVGRYYGYEDDQELKSKTEVTDIPGGGMRAQVPVVSPGGEVQGTQVFEVLPGRRLRVAVEVGLTTPIAALLEHRVAQLVPGLLTGRPYQMARAGAQPESGVVPVPPLPGPIEESKVATEFATLRLESRLGPIDIATTGPVPITLLDYRRNRWASGKEFFWFGALEKELPSSGTVAYELEFRFPEPLAADEGHTVRVSGGLRAVKSALGAETRDDELFPTPKSIQWLGDAEEESGHLVLGALGDDDATLGPVAAVLRGYDREHLVDALALLRNSGLVSAPSDEALLKSVRFVDAHDPAPPPQSLILSLLDDLKLADGLPGSYRMRLDGHVRVDAATTEGLVMAVQTLRQLRRVSDTGDLSLRRCEIVDGPSLPFRGVHFFTGKDARDLQRRMVREVLGPLKFNTLVYQADYLKWASQPAIHHAEFGMDMDDARAVVEEAHRQHVEIVPLVNTFGHSEWLLNNDTYRHLADNPNDPYAYDPSNPEVYRVCEGIYEEALELFQPRMVHIGHDEVTIEGFPVREENRKVGVRELMLRDIRHYHAFLGARGVRTMIWGDMFLAPGEASDAAFAASLEESALKRAGLPKDIIMCDWHYGPDPAEKFISLGVFNRDGFDAIACTWSNPANIAEFAKAALNERKTTGPAESRGETWGLLQTTWAGYSFGEQSFLTEPDQYSAYLLAAESAWNGGRIAPALEDFGFRQKFAELWTRSLLPEGTAPGWQIELPRHPVMSIDAPEHVSWFDLPEDGQPLPKGAVRLGRYDFLIPESNERAGAVLFTGRLNPVGADAVDELRLEAGQPADALVFLVSATFGASGQHPVAYTDIVREDGTTETLAWRVGFNVYPLTDRRTSAASPVVWDGTSPAGLTKLLHAHVWTNSRPDVGIRELHFRSARQGSALLLLGVTGVQGGGTN